LGPDYKLVGIVLYLKCTLLIAAFNGNTNCTRGFHSKSGKVASIGGPVFCHMAITSADYSDDSAHTL